MNATADMERDLDGLGRLAQRDLGLAMRYADRIEALGEDEDDRAVALARPYQIAARSYRQSLAMKARLRRELDARQRREPAPAHFPKGTFGRLERMAEIETAVRPLMWSEYEGAEPGVLDEDLVDVMRDAFTEDGFEDLPLDLQVARVAELLGLGEAADDEPAAEAAPEAQSPAEPPPETHATERAAPEEPPVEGPPAEDLPTALAPEPDPPPRPPDPPADPPYIPPWERAPPGMIFPGGSGW